MPDRPASLDIIAGSTYLSEQEAIARATKNRLAWPVAILWTVAILVVLGQLLSRWFLDMDPAYFAVSGLLLVASLAATWLFPVIDSHEKREQDFGKGRAGEEAVAHFLREHLNGDWTLHRNLLLPDDKGDIDAVLLGPGGLFVLEVKAWTGAYRVTGTRWHKRTPSGGWRSVSGSPSGQALANVRRLEVWLNAQGVCLTAHPRIVWAGPGSVQFIKSSVPVWLLAKPAYIHREMKPSNSLSSESRRQIARALTRLVG